MPKKDRIFDKIWFVLSTLSRDIILFNFSFFLLFRQPCINIKEIKSIYLLQFNWTSAVLILGTKTILINVDKCLIFIPIMFNVYFVHQLIGSLYLCVCLNFNWVSIKPWNTFLLSCKVFTHLATFKRSKLISIHIAC